ncbi:hypothetical protein Tco_0193886 [Tanacetum coccineum]
MEVVTPVINLLSDSLYWTEVGYDMEHYLEYIDNEVWKVIQNGNSKKRVTKGKDGVYRVLPPTTQADSVADEVERKIARNITANGWCRQKIISEVFMAFRMMPNISQKKAINQEVIVLIPTSSSKATPTASPGLAVEVIHFYFVHIQCDDVDFDYMTDLVQIVVLVFRRVCDINWQIAMTAIKD